jgi:cell division septum initiation protein DivIVA
MVDEVIKESTLTEDIFKGLTLPGSLARQAIKNTFQGYNDEDGFTKIIRGEKEVTPRDLIGTIEDRTGLDFTLGDKDNQTTTDKVVNIGRDIVLDIFTSPDSLIAGPAKLLRAGGVLKGAASSAAKTAARGGIAGRIAAKATEKSLEKAMVGATFGALTVRPDDDVTEIMAKIGTGAATVALGGPALRAGAKFAGELGTSALDSIVKNANKEAFRITENAVAAGERTVSRFSQAKKIRKLELEDNKFARKLFVQKTTRVINDFEQSLVARGLTPEQVLSKTDELRDAVILGEESLIKRRNVLKTGMREVLQNNGAGLNKLGITDEKVKAALEGRISEGVKNLDDVTANRLATAQANIDASNKILGITKDPSIATTLQDFTNSNRELSEVFNRKTLAKVRQLEKLGGAENLKKAGILEDQMFVPLAFHTINLKSLDDLATVESKLGNVVTGPSLRTSSKVMKDIQLSLREEVIEGSHKYASLFATEAQKEASQLLGKVYSNSNEILSKFRGKKPLELLDMFADKTIPATEKAQAGLEIYDKFINLLKTKHLATSSSWVITNYVDNVVKAFVYGSPGSALKVATQIPAQAVGAAIGKIDDKFLGGAADILTGGALKSFAKKNTFAKLFKAFDPTDLSKIDYQDEWMDGMALFGGIDSNKFLDFRRGVNQGDGIIAVKNGLDGNKVGGEIVREFRNVPRDEFLGKIQDFFWKTTGNVGASTEGTARYIVFKDLVEAQADNLPGLKRVLSKKGELDKVYRGIPKLDDFKSRDAFSVSRLEELEHTKLAFKSASKKVNDIFFDYDDVTAFEQHVMKRIFPYWTFFSRNFHQWLDKGFDASRIGRTAKIATVPANLGRPLTEEERLKTPDFLLQNGARIDHDSNGDLNFVYQPNSSLLDAVNSISDPGGKLLGTLSPPLKIAGEVAFNRESFGKDVPVFPTEDKPKKRILDSALTLLPDDILENLGIFRDENGRFFTNSKASAALNKSQELLPIPQILSQISRANRDLDKGQGIAQASLNVFPFAKVFEGDSTQLQRLATKRKKNILRKEGGKEELFSDGRRSGRRRRKRTRRKRSRK